MITVTIVAAYVIAASKGLSIEPPLVPLAGCGILYAYGLVYYKRSPYIKSVCHNLTYLSLFCTYFALLADSVASGCVLHDDWLLAADGFIGVNARGIADWVHEVRWLDKISFVAYFSMMPQIIVAILVGSREAFVKRIMAAGLITTMVFALVPANGNYTGVTPQCHNAPIQERMAALSASEVPTLRVQDAEGIICAPSFHTVNGVLLTVALWGCRLRWWVLGLNVLMVGSTIPTGGHYVVDVLAGLLVAAVVVRTIK